MVALRKWVRTRLIAISRVLTLLTLTPTTYTRVLMAVGFWDDKSIKTVALEYMTYFLPTIYKEMYIF